MKTCKHFKKFLLCENSYFSIAFTIKNILYGYCPTNHCYAFVVETLNLKMRLLWWLQRWTHQICYSISLSLIIWFTAQSGYVANILLHYLYFFLWIVNYDVYISQAAAEFCSSAASCIRELLDCSVFLLWYFWAFDPFLMLTVEAGLSHTIVRIFLEVLRITVRSVTVWNIVYHVPVWKLLPRKLWPWSCIDKHTWGHWYFNNPPKPL